MIAKPATETPRIPTMLKCKCGEYKELKHDKVIIVKRGGVKVDLAI